MPRCLLYRRTGLLFHRALSGVYSSLPRLYAKRSAEDGNLLASGAPHRHRILVGAFLRRMAVRRLFRGPLSLYVRGLWSRHPGTLVQPDCSKRLLHVPVDQSDNRGGALLFRLMLGFTPLATVAALSGCANFVGSPPVMPRTVQSFTKIQPQPQLGQVFFMPASPVTRVRDAWIPAIILSNTHAHSSQLQKTNSLPALVKVTSISPHSSANAPQKTFPLRMSHVTHVTSNPWHCRKTIVPCAVGKAQGSDWWRCSRHAVSTSTFQPTEKLTARALTGISTARFLPPHSATGGKP